MEKIKIPTIIGILMLTMSLSIATILVKQKRVLLIGAQQDHPPQDVKITNITDSSFTVIWSTNQQTTGFIQWGENKNDLNKTSPSEIEDKSYLHSSTISGLEPNKTYYFKINSNRKVYGNDQKAWEVKTAPKRNTDSPSGGLKIGGKVVTASGGEAGNIIIILQIEGAQLLSTITSQNGNWIISLDTVIDNNLNNYLELSPETKASVIAQGGPQGISTAKFYLKAGQSLPPMVLGQNHDFTNLSDIQEVAIPTSEINAAQKMPKKARFNIEGETEIVNENEEISLDSIEDKEIIHTTNPEFFGKAPPQKEITIRIESESLISETIKASQDGTWRWSPPTHISPGDHKIIISYRDNNGVLKSIVKNFTVQAAEANEPAFESTPSASLTPTPRSTASTTKTASPSATPTQPISGTKTPTLIFLSISLLLFATSGLLLFANQ